MARKKEKRLLAVFEEHKQRVTTKKIKIRQGQLIQQYQRNRLFRTKFESFHREISGECTGEGLVPDGKGYQRFRSDIWSKREEHKDDA